MACDHPHVISLGKNNEWLWCKKCGALGQSPTRPPDPRLNPSMMRPEQPRRDGKIHIVWYLPTDAALEGFRDILDMRVLYMAPDE